MGETTLNPATCIHACIFRTHCNCLQVSLRFNNVVAIAIPADHTLRLTHPFLEPGLGRMERGPLRPPLLQKSFLNLQLQQKQYDITITSPLNHSNHDNHSPALPQLCSRLLCPPQHSQGAALLPFRIPATNLGVLATAVGCSLIGSGGTRSVPQRNQCPGRIPEKISREIYSTQRLETGGCGFESQPRQLQCFSFNHCLFLDMPPYLALSLPPSLSLPLSLTTYHELFVVVLHLLMTEVALRLSLQLLHSLMEVVQGLLRWREQSHDHYEDHMTTGSHDHWDHMTTGSHDHWDHKIKRVRTHALNLLKQQLLSSLLQAEGQRLPLNFDLGQPRSQPVGCCRGRRIDDEIDVGHSALYFVVLSLQLTGMSLRQSNDIIMM